MTVPGPEVTRLLKAIEQWASQSDDRVRLLIILIWAGFGILVLLVTSITAWIMLSPNGF